MVGDTVWLDDGDGIYEEDNEEGLPGVIVRLIDRNSEEVVQETSSDQDGFYQFANVPDGEYILEYTAPDELQLTLKDRGNDDKRDSDPDPNTNRTGVFSVRDGDVQDFWDAGFVHADSPPPTATPTDPVLHPPSTATPTREPTATPTPNPNRHQQDDPEGDTVICNSQEEHQDPRVDIKQVIWEWTDDGSLVVRVLLLNPPENPAQSEFSYAVGLILNPNQEKWEIFWQIHNGQEQTDPRFAWQSVPLPDGSEVLAGVFNLPPESLPESLQQLQVLTFHMGDQDSKCGHDQALIENPS